VNIGPVHLISFSSEYYYFVQYGWEQIIRQYDWIERDLMVSLLHCYRLKPACGPISHPKKFPSKYLVLKSWQTF